MNFGEKVQEIMIWAHTNQKQLHESTGISRSTLSEYVRGTRSPTVDNAQKIADALKVSLWTLLNGEPLAVEAEELTREERLLVGGYRRLDPKFRKLVQETIQTCDPKP